MLLNLKYEPGPETAPRFAADIVELAQRISGVTLDYSEESLAHVDTILQSFANDGVEIEQIKGTLFGFGCYGTSARALLPLLARFPAAGRSRLAWVR